MSSKSPNGQAESLPYRQPLDSVSDLDWDVDDRDRVEHRPDGAVVVEGGDSPLSRAPTLRPADDDLAVTSRREARSAGPRRPRKPTVRPGGAPPPRGKGRFVVEGDGAPLSRVPTVRPDGEDDPAAVHRPTQRPGAERSPTVRPGASPASPGAPMRGRTRRPGDSLSPAAGRPEPRMEMPRAQNAPPKRKRLDSITDVMGSDELGAIMDAAPTEPRRARAPVHERSPRPKTQIPGVYDHTPPPGAPPPPPARPSERERPAPPSADKQRRVRAKTWPGTGRPAPSPIVTPSSSRSAQRRAETTEGPVPARVAQRRPVATEGPVPAPIAASASAPLPTPPPAPPSGPMFPPPAEPAPPSPPSSPQLPSHPHRPESRTEAAGGFDGLEAPPAERSMTGVLDDEVVVGARMERFRGRGPLIALVAAAALLVVVVIASSITADAPGRAEPHLASAVPSSMPLPEPDKAPEETTAARPQEQDADDVQQPEEEDVEPPPDPERADLRRAATDRPSARGPAGAGADRKGGGQFLGTYRHGRGTINASSNEPCLFWLDGYQQGVSRGVSLDVAPGDHVVTCRLASGPVDVRHLRVRPGQTVSVGFRFYR